MNNFNIFVVLSIVAAASLFAGIAMVTPVVAQANSTMPLGDMGNMTMTMDNSTSMTDNSTDSGEESSENGEESSENGEESSENGEESSENGEESDN